MFFNNNLERPDVFLDEETIFKVSPNHGLNFTHLRTTGPRPLVENKSLTIKKDSFGLVFEMNQITISPPIISFCVCKCVRARVCVCVPACLTDHIITPFNCITLD